MTLTDSTVEYATAAVNPHTGAHPKKPRFRQKTCEGPRKNVWKTGPVWLFAEGLGRRREDPWDSEGLGEIPRDTEVHGLNRAGLG